MCPLCDDHNFHGGFNEWSGHYHCWRCGGSKPAWVISKLLRVGFHKAQTIVVDFEGDSPDPIQRREAGGKPFEFPQGTRDLTEQQKAYLAGRGFDPEHIAAKYGVMGTGPFGPLAHRVVLPIFYEGEPVSWQARTIFAKTQPRYMSCPLEIEVIPNKSIFYNLDNCRSRRVLVVEGPMDVWKLGDGACASFGTSLTMAQVNVLAARFDILYIMFDPEPAAQEKAKMLSDQLAMVGKESYVVKLDPGADPGELPDDQIRNIREELQLHGDR